MDDAEKSWWCLLEDAKCMPDLYSMFFPVLLLVAVYVYTPSIPNCKSFQESWRVKAFSHLTKIIEKNTKICNVKWVYYENIIKKESNDT